MQVIQNSQHIQITFETSQLDIQLSSDVFRPTSTTFVLADFVHPKSTDAVLDLGCGSGIIGLIAAARGAQSVTCVDSSAQACTLAKRNVELNQLTHIVNVVQSNLFDNLPRQSFDLIIDDVSGIAESVGRMSGWYPDSIETGGVAGTDFVCKMLKVAPSFLKPRGRLILPVSSLSHSDSILSIANESFGGNIKLLVEKEYPFPSAMAANLPALHQLREEGLIDFRMRGSRALWKLSIFSAQISM